jgi:hypothetical protein
VNTPEVNEVQLSDEVLNTIRAAVTRTLSYYKLPHIDVAQRTRTVPSKDKNGKRHDESVSKPISLRRAIADEAVNDTLAAVLANDNPDGLSLEDLAARHARRLVRCYDDESYRSHKHLSQDSDPEGEGITEVESWDDVSMRGASRSHYEYETDDYGHIIGSTQTVGGTMGSHKHADWSKLNKPPVFNDDETEELCEQIEESIGSDRYRWMLEYSTTDYAKSGKERSKFHYYATKLRNLFANSSYGLRA